MQCWKLQGFVNERGATKKDYVCHVCFRSHADDPELLEDYIKRYCIDPSLQMLRSDRIYAVAVATFHFRDFLQSRFECELSEPSTSAPGDKPTDETEKYKLWVSEKPTAARKS